MLEKFKEFKDTLSERVRSPFIGSFIITWSIIHWKVYALFLFSQQNITISERIELIDGYLLNKNIFELFICPALITLILLLVYSFLNAIGLAIKLIYQNWVSPLIQSVFNNKNIMEKPKYDRLKKDYASMKKDFEENKESLIKIERDAKTLELNYENFQKKSFQGTLINDITHVMNRNTEWENFHIYPDGKTGIETFTCDIDGFHIKNGKVIQLNNIKSSENGKILAFEKLIDGKILQNYLIRDNELNFHGIEDNNIKITYRKKKKDGIIISSAVYKSENSFVNVKSKIQQLADNGIVEFIITNELMGVDPEQGKPKKLEIIYTINDREYTATSQEGSNFKFFQ